MGDGTAEIATLSQKLAALAVAETDKDNVFLQERSRHNATEADKTKSTTTLDVRERAAAFLRDMNTSVEG
jgi:hypothetical protein